MHQFVVQLMKPVLPRREPLETLACEIVVIGDEDVRVRVPSGGVGVDGDQVVRAVHSLCQFLGHLTHPVEVLLVGDVEFVGMESQHVTVELVLPPVCLSQALSTMDELLRRRPSRRPHHERRGSCLFTLDKVETALRIASVEHIINGASSAGRGADGNGAHV